MVSVQAGRLTELQQLPCQILPLMEMSPSSKRSPIHTGLSAARQWNNLIPQASNIRPKRVIGKQGVVITHFTFQFSLSHITVV